MSALAALLSVFYHVWGGVFEPVFDFSLTFLLCRFFQALIVLFLSTTNAFLQSFRFIYCQKDREGTGSYSFWYGFKFCAQLFQEEFCKCECFEQCLYLFLALCLVWVFYMITAGSVLVIYHLSVSCNLSNEYKYFKNCQILLGVKCTIVKKNQ